MKLNKLLGTLNFAITTLPINIVIPKKYIGASVILIGAQTGDEFIPWERRAYPEASESKLCPDEDIALSINITQEDQNIFAASTLSGSGVLEIELWK